MNRSRQLANILINISLNKLAMFVVKSDWPIWTTRY